MTDDAVSPFSGPFAVRVIRWLCLPPCVAQSSGGIAILGLLAVVSERSSLAITSKRCRNCGKKVSWFAKRGEACLHCGVKWSDEISSRE